MDGTFTRFPYLPPEIRQEVWRHALALYWSFSQPTRNVRRRKLVGKVHQEIGQSCCEARAVMKTTHTNIDTLGWIDFGRHLFFFRDSSYGGGLMKLVEDRYDILSRSQHIFINPRDWPHLWETVDVIKSRCTALRTLVVVAPWFDPDDMPVSRNILDYAPYEDWAPVFQRTPTEMDLTPLLGAIKDGTAANALRNAQYQFKLDQAAQQTPSDEDEVDYVYSRTRRNLLKLVQAVQDLPHGEANLYLRTRDELIRSSLVLALAIDI